MMCLLQAVPLSLFTSLPLNTYLQCAFVNINSVSHSDQYDFRNVQSCLIWCQTDHAVISKDELR